MTKRFTFPAFFYSICMLVLHTGIYAQSTARLIPKKGFFFTSHQLNWISGSAFNLFTPDKKNHHYYFTWWEQDADSTQPGKDLLFIGSRNTALNGTWSLQQKGSLTQIDLDCQYNFPDSALADLVHARLWLPYLQNSQLLVGDRLILPEQFSSFNDTAFVLVTPFGTFRFSSSKPFRLRTDAEAVVKKDDYTRRNQFLVLYEDDIPVSQKQSLKRNFTVEEISTSPQPKAQQLKLSSPAIPVARAWEPAELSPDPIPLPRSQQWKAGEWYVIPDTLNKEDDESELPISEKNNPDRWQIELVSRVSSRLYSFRNVYPFIRYRDNRSLPREAYRIQISQQGIFVECGSIAARNFAFSTLAQLTVVRNNRLCLPIGTISDEPKSDWRGIHMFTGKQSRRFHVRMLTRIMSPLKMNKVVLQCEQAEWSSFPNVHNPISISMQELEATFSTFRNFNIEPIPLIQSLGHMEWFFKPRANRYMAVNPEYPYTLNPQLPDSRKAITAIWNEVFTRLHPVTIHIGFDEIGMIGFNQPRSKEIEYFTSQIGLLDSLARANRARLMLWGDMGLAPGEGPDACNGIDAERAARIRSLIPKGSLVADWHYLGNSDPAVYRNSLQLWKKEGLDPIASPWFNPNNIKGFSAAAQGEGAGILQTTWADFESSEENMLKHIEQFGAWVLALDYAWSGRKELPNQLPYDPVEKWNELYFDPGMWVENLSGWQLFTDNLIFQDITGPGRTALQSATWKLPAGKEYTGLCAVFTPNKILPEGAPIALVECLDGKKTVHSYTIRYGVDARAIADGRPIFARQRGKDAKTWHQLIGFPRPFSTLRVTVLHPASGLQLKNFLVLEKPKFSGPGFVSQKKW